jgi:hypothetical protein
MRLSTARRTIVWANQTTKQVVVSHSLGYTPSVVMVLHNGNAADRFFYQVVAKTSTTFTVEGGGDNGGLVTATRSFDWIAIG